MLTRQYGPLPTPQPSLLRPSYPEYDPIESKANGWEFYNEDVDFEVMRDIESLNGIGIDEVPEYAQHLGNAVRLSTTREAKPLGKGPVWRQLTHEWISAILGVRAKGKLILNARRPILDVNGLATGEYSLHLPNLWALVPPTRLLVS